VGNSVHVVLLVLARDLPVVVQGEATHQTDDLDRDGEGRAVLQEVLGDHTQVVNALLKTQRQPSSPATGSVFSLTALKCRFTVKFLALNLSVALNVPSVTLVPFDMSVNISCSIVP
jgi:hypothetical protein